MTTARSHYLTCEGRELHFMEWGARDAEVVIAWHGLARTGRDMDWIAAHLAGDRGSPAGADPLGGRAGAPAPGAPRTYRVICPDTLGRGLSQWSPEPAREYSLAFYEALAVSLLDQLGVQRCHWLGTSMGGAIGLRAAAGRLRGRIKRLVLNDIGPQLAEAAITRIRSYAGNPPAFASLRELETYFRTVYAPYGWLSDEMWRQLTETSARRLPSGQWTPHYDPEMVQQFIHHPADYTQWEAWDSLDIPVLCLRGETSDLLLRETAEAMRNRGPRAVVVEMAGCGHAPALNTPEHYALVERFFGGEST